MADMSWEHAAEARAALNAIVTDPEHGVAALSSAQTMSNLLKDLLPDAPREKSMLVAAAEAGLASSLRDHVAQGMDPGTAIRLTASTFSATTPFTPEACSWVAGEIAIALGISTPGAAGGAAPPGGAPGWAGGAAPPGGTPGWAGGAAQPGGAPGPTSPLGGTPPGFDQLGQQGMSTQLPTGYPSGPAQGWPQGYADPPIPGYPQAPGQGGGFAGGGQPTLPGQWQGGGAYGPGGGLPGGPPRRKRGIFVAGGLVVVFIVVIAAIALRGSPTPPTPTPTPTPSPSLTPSPTPPVSTVESLSQIINPPGLDPIGTKCALAGLAGLNAATVTNRLRCNTTVTSMYVWAYQFDSAADYQLGFAHLQKFLAFTPSSAGNSCPPTGSSSTGSTNWRNSDNPKYHSYTGQFLDCLTVHGTYGTEVTYLWTVPSQHAIFLAQSWNTNITFSTLDNWWSHLSYG